MAGASDKAMPLPAPNCQHPARSRRTLKWIGGMALLVLAMILYVNWQESRQREMDRFLYLAVYGEDPAEVERLLKLGANPNSRLNDRPPNWVQRFLLLAQGRDIWRDPRVGWSGSLLTMSDQRMPRINTFLKSFKKRKPSSVVVDEAMIAQEAAARRRMDRLNRVHDILVNAGARP